MQRWQLRTWSKGTGASVEPVGAADRPPAPARPGGLRPLPPRGPWTAHTGPDSRPGQGHRTAVDARRRHARRVLDDAAIDGLEQLEAELSR